MSEEISDYVIDYYINLAREEKILDRLIYPYFISNAQLKMNWKGI